MASLLNCFAKLFPKPSSKATHMSQNTTNKAKNNKRSSEGAVAVSPITVAAVSLAQDEAAHSTAAETKVDVVRPIGLQQADNIEIEHLSGPAQNLENMHLEEPGQEQIVNDTPRITVQEAMLGVDNAESLPRPSSEASLHPRLSRDDSMSQAPHRTRTNSRGSLTLGNKLKDELDRACLESPKHHHCSFIPRSAQDDLISIENVVEDLRTRGVDLDDQVALKLATTICKRAKRLYATLAYVKKGSYVVKLLDDGFSDDDLPFTRDPRNPSKVLSKNGKDRYVSSFGTWTDKHLKKFVQYQWWMSAPVFELNEPMYDLDSKTILPFVHIDRTCKKHGGYSEVYPVRIHPSHHNFWKSTGGMDDEPLVAVKQLFSDDWDEFDKERSILTTISVKDHPHLIKLFATYKFDGHYHLMFPYANSNLRKYWEDRPDPNFDDATVLWSLQQMAGIASGLARIHNFRPSRPLSIKGPGNARIQGDAKLSVETNEAQFGRHGDIKPENVLWFERSLDSKDPKGILQIADFGLGRFHGRDSRSRVNPDSVSFSPTYEPPECKMRQPVSRAYDLWSLGCLYLEFITWLLRGSAEIDAFSRFRLRLNTSTDINDDNFFTIVTMSHGQQTATVREQVVAWANDLHRHERCSDLMHELLDLTMHGLLVVDSRDRLPVGVLLQNLSKCLARAQVDTDYMLKPTPREFRPERGRAGTAPELIRTQRDTATGSRREPARTSPSISPVLRSTKDNVHATLPRDLVFRASGHPKKIRTWPVNGPMPLAMGVSP